MNFMKFSQTNPPKQETKWKLGDIICLTLTNCMNHRYVELRKSTTTLTSQLSHRTRI